jgi:predicted dehydrogenase
LIHLKDMALKFLIAGLGSIGRRHLHNLVALGQEDILLYRTHQSTLPDKALAPYQVETDLAAALAQKPDAVIVSNPTAMHLDVAIPAASAGCHLLLEKPVAAKMDDRIETLHKLALEAGIQTLVGFQFRFHPVLNQVKALLERGGLGRVYSFRAHWGEYLPGWHPWEDYQQSYAARKDLGGGVVNTLCHPLDYVRWLFGEVTTLSAVTGQVSELELDVEDVAEISLVMEKDIIGSIHLDYFQRPPAHWLAVNCEKGILHWDNATGAAKVFNADKDKWDMIEPPSGFERNDLFLEEMRHFLELIAGEEPSRCSLQDGIQALKLTSLVQESSLGHYAISL